MPSISDHTRQLRKEYRRHLLLESEVDVNPFVQFRRWFDEAVKAELLEPNAMALATVGADGAPSVRMVLMKELSDQGISFFTNYESRKGQDLAAHPSAALLFYWAELERQVRIEGEVNRLSRAENQHYFASRPLSARLGSIASKQSKQLTSRADLEERYQELELRYRNSEPECPEHWGGFLLKPQSFEFWQGRESRLHDRLLYSSIHGGFRLERLSP